MNVEFGIHFVKRDIICSVQPILLLLKLIGINLEQTKKGSRFKRWLFYLYSLAWIMLDLYCFVTTAFSVYNSVKLNNNSNIANNKQTGLPNDWSIIIDKANNAGKQSSKFKPLFI